jgi:Methyltransferase domain
MSGGEQAAIEGLLARLRPRIAVEIGTAEGAAARFLAARAEEVHVFDLEPPKLEMPENVAVHIGDSHELLPAVLAQLTEQGRNVDFAIVDGDHSAAGARQDIEDLLDSPAVGRTVIAIHDTVNERVRLGVEAVRYAAWPKVAYVHLDWIPGQLFREPGLENELWYGLGLVVVDSSRSAYEEGEVFEQRYFPAAPLLAEGRRQRVGVGDGSPEPRRPGLPNVTEDLRWELDRARELLGQQQRELAAVLASPSWRLTAPLRRAKRRLVGLRGALRRGGRGGDAGSARLG